MINLALQILEQISESHFFFFFNLGLFFLFRFFFLSLGVFLVISFCFFGSGSGSGGYGDCASQFRNSFSDKLKIKKFLTCWADFPLQAATTKATTAELGLIPAEAKTSLMFLSSICYLNRFTDFFSG